MMRVVGLKARDGSDAQNARSFVRRATVKVMLGEAAHKPVAPEEQSQRLDDRSLTAIVRADQHGVAAQRNIRRAHSAEARDLQADDVHFAISR
jgi:hypothetical protein